MGRRRIRISEIILAFAAALLPFAPVAAQRGPGSAELSLDSLLGTRISTASKYAQRSAEAPASVTIITADEIERFGFRNLQDVLETVRGFYVSYDRNYASLGTRGFGRPTDYNNRVLLLIDGHTMNEQLWGSTNIGADCPIDLDAVQRIEVVRGPGSALYGTSAMFAVINIVTKSGTELDRVALSLRGGTGNAREGAIALGRAIGATGSFALSGIVTQSDGRDLYYAEYDSPSTNFGVTRNTDWEKSGGLLTTFSQGTTALRVGYQSRTKGVPTGSFGTLFNDPRAETVDERLWADLKVEREFSAAFHLTGRLYADRYRFRGVYPETPATVSSDGGKSTHFGGEALLTWDVSSRNRLSVGTELRQVVRAEYYQRQADGTLTRDDAPFDVTSFFAQSEWQVTPKLTAVAGMRYDHNSTTRAALTPRIALVATLDDRTSMKLLYGEAFRAPSPAEADLTTAYYTRNPDLKPERIATVELDVQRRLTGSLLAGIAVYQYRIRNLIDQAPVSGAVNTVEFQNLATAHATGAELQLDAVPDGPVSAHFSYAWQRATVDPDGMRLTNSPERIAVASLATREMHGVRTAVIARHESERRTIDGLRSPAFTRTDLTVGYALPKPFRLNGGDTHVSLRATNLFDVKYYVPGGAEHRQSFLEQDGRSFRIHFDARF